MIDFGKALFGVALTAILCAASPAAAEPDGALARLKEIHRAVMDPTTSFSISATLGELDELERKIAPAGPDSAERGELAFLRGFVLYRADRGAETVAPNQEARRIDQATPFLTAFERMRLVYRMASQAESDRDWDAAISDYRAALALMADDRDVTDDMRLGTRERLGYCLHEAKRFGEARTVNLDVLAGGEALFGRDSDKLLVVITNLAQNTYELKDFSSARGHLERRLAIATKADNASHIDDSYFQLGVLAFEQNRFDEAKSLTTRRLEIAKASGDEDRVAAAEADLDILKDKMKR